MSTPGPKETVELLTETVRQRIVERLDEVQPLLKAAREQAASKYGATGKRLKAISPEAYRNIERLAKESKKLTRGLGGLLTSDPLQAVNPASGETWGSVLQDIMDKNIVGERLAQRLDAFGSFVDFTKGGKALQGVVGHHRTALSTLRELFKNKPFDFRRSFKKIAQKAGYKIGEEFIDFIDPAAHMAFTKNVNGILKDRLGFLKKGDIPETLAKELADRFAHAAQFGGTKGFDVPKGFLKEGVSAEKVFQFSKPYLEAAERGAQAGKKLDEVLRSDAWRNIDELTEQVKAIDIGTTDDLLDVSGASLYKRADILNPSKLPGRRNVLKLPEGLTINDINPDVVSKYDEVITQPHLFKSVVNEASIAKTKRLKALRAKALLGAGIGLSGISILGTGASAAETATRTQIAAETGHWLDKTQAGISAFSLANDVGSYTGAWALPGAILSSAADVTNIVIDKSRGVGEEEKEDEYQYQYSANDNEFSL